MATAPDIMERLLVELCRFLIEAADAVRELAPLRTPEVAARLGIALDEADPDWQKLAFRALRVMLDAEQENARRDQGDFGGPSGALQAARKLVDVASPARTLPVLHRTVPMPPEPTQVPPAASITLHGVSLSLAVPLHAGPTEAALVQPPEVVNTETVPIVAAPRQPGSEWTSCATIKQGSEDYIKARSQGYRTFKHTEQANEADGKSWARNSAPNVRSTARLFSRILSNKPLGESGIPAPGGPPGGQRAPDLVRQARRAVPHADLPGQARGCGRSSD